MDDIFTALFNKAAPKNMSYRRLLTKFVISKFHMKNNVKYFYMTASGTKLSTLVKRKDLKKTITELRKTSQTTQTKFIAKYLLGLAMDIRFFYGIDEGTKTSFDTCVNYLIYKSKLDRNEVLKIVIEANRQNFNDFIEAKIKAFELEEKISSEEEDIIIKETNETVKLIKISDEKEDLNLYCLDCIKNKNNSCKRDNPENCEFSETVKDLIGTRNLKKSPYINKSDYLKSFNIDLETGKINANREQIRAIVDYYRIGGR